MADDYESIIVTEKNVLIKEIKNHDWAIVSKILEELFLSIQERRYFKKKNTENLCVELFELLSQSLGETEKQEMDVIKESIKIVREKPIFDTVKDYRDFVMLNFENILNKYKLASTRKYSLIIINAIKYVNANYEKDITVEYMARLAGKTPNYFSHIFKKEYGMSFVQFLNKVRIEKAKEYICYSDLRLYEIAERVGYKDYSYFTQVYKKVEGYPPANLRKGEEI
jgi:two-component system response regulator YesN